MNKSKWWPNAKLENGEMLHVISPAAGPKDCLDIVNGWNNLESIKEAWIDITVDDDLEPVKRIPLKRVWKLGKPIILKEE